MPTYEYVCDACEHRVDYFQSMSEAPKKKCPKCGKSKLVRQIGAGAAILFKGSGFYQTDYRSDSYKKSASAESSSNGCGGDTKSCADNGGPCATSGNDAKSNAGDNKSSAKKSDAKKKKD